MELNKLKEPMPYKWKIQSYNFDKTKGTCVAYIDARDVMDRFDEVVSPENWQKKYYSVKNTMFCSIGIKIGNDWVWKDDGGVESTQEKEKGEASDSFKRAAVNWGVGRFLYDLDIRWIDIKDKKPVDKAGEVIKDLTKYFEKLDEVQSYQKPGTLNSRATTAPQNGQGDVCSNCGDGVTDKVAEYSKGKFGKILCYDCQKLN